MNCFSLLSGIMSFVWINGITTVISSKHHEIEYSALDDCDGDCWANTVLDSYDSLKKLELSENLQALALGIHEWHQVSYLNYYINDLNNGKKFNKKNSKDIEAKKRYNEYQDMLKSLSKNGYTFEDYQKEKIRVLGNIGKLYAEKYYGKYNNLDDLDLSFDNYILTHYREECGSDCEDYIAKIQPSIIHNLVWNVVDDLGVGFKLGHEYNVLSEHYGYGIGVATNGLLRRWALYESRYTGNHIISKDASSFGEVSLFDDFDKIEGKSKYHNNKISSKLVKENNNINCATIKSQHKSVGTACSFGDAINAETPVTIDWTDDETSFIWSVNLDSHDDEPPTPTLAARAGDVLPTFEAQDDTNILPTFEDGDVLPTFDAKDTNVLPTFEDGSDALPTFGADDTNVLPTIEGNGIFPSIENAAQLNVNIHTHTSNKAEEVTKVILFSIIGIAALILCAFYSMGNIKNNKYFTIKQKGIRNRPAVGETTPLIV